MRLVLSNTGLLCALEDVDESYRLGRLMHPEDSDRARRFGWNLKRNLMGRTDVTLSEKFHHVEHWQLWEHVRFLMRSDSNACYAVYHSAAAFMARFPAEGFVLKTLEELLNTGIRVKRAQQLVRIFDYHVKPARAYYWKRLACRPDDALTNPGRYGLQWLTEANRLAYFRAVEVTVPTAATTAVPITTTSHSATALPFVAAAVPVPAATVVGAPVTTTNTASIQSDAESKVHMLQETLVSQSDEMNHLHRQHEAHMAAKEEQVESLKKEMRMLRQALRDSADESAKLEDTVSKNAAELLEITEHHAAELREIAEQASNGGQTAKPGSLLQQMQLHSKKAKALKEAERLSRDLCVANQKVEKQLLKRQDTAQKHESGVIGKDLLKKGSVLLKSLGTDKDRRGVVERSQVGQGAVVSVPPEKKTRFNQILAHLELEICAASRGDFDQGHLLVAGLIERPAVKAMLRQRDLLTQHGERAMRSALEHARNTLASLQTGGTRCRDANLSFEAGLSILIPDNASELRIEAELSRLLDVNVSAVRRASKRGRDAYADYDGFVSVIFRPRKRRIDFIWFGRQVAAEFWHAFTRVDTRPGRKIRIRVGSNRYVEHWRHIQFMANWEMAVLFFDSYEYKSYLEISRGIPFKEDVFYSAKCKCIKQAEDEECSCPDCTVFREAVRSYNKQRVQWHRKAKDEGKACTNCPCQTEEFLHCGKSSSTFRAFIHRHCGKVEQPALVITDGPKASTSIPKFYQRQCCRVPLPELKPALEAVRVLAVAVKDSAAPEEIRKLQDTATRLAGAEGLSIDDVRSCMDCEKCDFLSSLPHCPVEWEDGPQTYSYKMYMPIVSADGNHTQNELREVKCSRRGLMEHLHRAYTKADPHLFIEEWTSQMRTMVYASLKIGELAVSTDFSAQYDHKAAWTLTCEHPPRSNMDVFVVTRVHIVEGRRIYLTDVWRIFSAAKGSSGFHNTALSQIAEYYRHMMELEMVWVFTDGCRGQYKGKRNFRRISTFSQEHSQSSFQLQPAPLLSFTSEKPPDLGAAAELAMSQAILGVFPTLSPKSRLHILMPCPCPTLVPTASSSRINRCFQHSEL